MWTPAPPITGRRRIDSPLGMPMSKPSLSTDKSAGGRSIADPKAARARLRDIIEKRSFGRGEITLASGRKSDFYFNLKPTMLDPEGATLLAELTFDALKDDN